ncbi:MAG: bifunctional adenosylcobinamide kinase/adenosylcobinamide-phosphate guanylyltransferase [Anaerolineales bacterium]|nr:bifunctional adenosylcobinamide kinase/adenosylcobinamide-phosphate guanylyltransferase [Anaerolineales bacterium]
MGRLILVLGGARSGKSDYAQQLAESLGSAPVYVATAQAHDEEMIRRISVHRASRAERWETIEAPLGVAQAVKASCGSGDVYLLDCLTLLVSNVMMELGEKPSEKDVEQTLQMEVNALIDLVRSGEAVWIVVSNEVGLGIVPAYASGRLYRDVLGRANQKIAAAADVVVFMVSGLPMVIKGDIQHGKSAE